MEKILIPIETEMELLETKMAELVKETNQFTYIITHDLQAPLRMVTGFLELLEKKYADTLDDQAKQYIGYAVKGSLKMKELIFDLLEYSRLSSVVYEFKETDLEEIINTAKSGLGAEIEQSNAVIQTGSLPLVYASPKLLQQVFTQLIENALKFRGDKSPVIRIHAEELEDSYKICVTDNSIGIDPAFFEKIFVVFRKLHTDEVKYPGTGIGLTICKKIAELHRGEIGVKSVPGEGSCFWITIPYV